MENASTKNTKEDAENVSNYTNNDIENVSKNIKEETSDECLENARQTLASVRETVGTCQAVLDQSREQNLLGASEDLDARWEQFEKLFSDMQRKLVSNLGASLKQEGLSSGSAMESVTEDAAGSLSDEDKRAVLNYDFSMANVAKTIENFVAQKKKIVVMAGAGMSVSAGIPDFRTPGTGLYHTLHKYNLPDLPSPEHLFAIDYFEGNPMPFTLLANSMLPGNYKPTPTHAFIKLLADKGLLARLYTQNIDTLELLAGIPKELTVFAHGSYADVHCIGDGCHRMKLDDWRFHIEKETPPRCEHCNSLVKPDIVFFGESLPKRYAELCQEDLEAADMLIIIGTSLVVSPFCTLAEMVSPTVPRVLINMEPVGQNVGLRYEEEDNYRDVFLRGACDAQVLELSKALGWSKELKNMIVAQNTQSFDGWKKVVEAQERLADSTT